MTDNGRSDDENNRITKEAILNTWNQLLEFGISREKVASYVLSLACATLTDAIGRENAAKSVEGLPDAIRSGVFDTMRK